MARASIACRGAGLHVGRHSWQQRQGRCVAPLSLLPGEAHLTSSSSCSEAMPFSLCSPMDMPRIGAGAAACMALSCSTCAGFGASALALLWELGGDSCEEKPAAALATPPSDVVCMSPSRC